jgi:hypothetical protein
MELVRQRWQDSVNMDMMELGQESVGWIKLAKDWFQSHALTKSNEPSGSIS